MRGMAIWEMVGCGLVLSVLHALPPGFAELVGFAGKGVVPPGADGGLPVVLTRLVRYGLQG